MSKAPIPLFAETLEAARLGSRDALGDALESCRAYLLLIANDSLVPRLQAKGGASDMVQLTFLEAQRDFSQFTGTTDPELRAWLKQLLLHNVADFVRNYRGTEKRQLDREQSLPRQTTQLPVDSTRIPSPSRQLVAQEESELVQQAIRQLPADYQQVIRLRYQEDLPFDVIAERLQRSENATRKLWFRAIEQLQALLESGR